METLLITIFIIILILAVIKISRNASSANKINIHRKIDQDTSTNKTITIQVIKPDSNNEFLFYDFISKTDYIFDYYDQVIKLGYNIKPDYLRAIQFKMKNGYFNNPFTFPEYFNSLFDFVSIDFETANNNRISACSIGLIFVKGDTIVYSYKTLIKPPPGQSFLKRYTDIHNITEQDVENAESFLEMWNNFLVKFLNKNLLICHNASMDISVLTQLATHYNLKDFEIRYIDTLTIAKDLGLPSKLIDLAEYYDLEIGDHHDPLNDANLCAQIFAEFSSNDLDLSFYERIAKPTPVNISSFKSRNARIHFQTDGNKVLKEFKVKKKDLYEFDFTSKNFLVTGDFLEDRDHIHEFIKNQNGFVKTSVSSKLNYVLIGDNYGWSKVNKIEEIIKSGKADIKIIYQKDYQFIKDLINNKTINHEI